MPPTESSHRRFRLGVVLLSVVAATVGSVLLATHASGEEATTRGVTATLRVPSSPGWLAAGEDALWVALAGTRIPVRERPLVRLDLASGAVERKILVGGRAVHLVHEGDRLLASVEHVGGSGSGPSLILVLDWRTGRILVRRQFPGALGPLAEAGNDLWALQIRPAALLRLDPLTLAPKAAPLPLPHRDPQGLAVGRGYVWATAPGEVLRIEPGTRAISHVDVGGSPAGVAFASGTVWFVDRAGGQVGRLDPRTLEPTGEPIRVGGRPAWLAQSGRYLFVGAAGDGTLSRIDTGSAREAGRPIRVAPPAEHGPPLAVAAAGRSVWVSSYTAGTAIRVSAEPDASAPRAVVASSSKATPVKPRALPRAGKVVASIAVPSPAGAFAVGQGAVWQMNDDDFELLRIDPGRNAIVARIKAGPVESVAAGHGAVWLSHPESDSVSRIDPLTNKKTATISVGSYPAGIAVAAGAVWVANSFDPSVSKIDPATNRVVATIRVGPKQACCSEHMGVAASPTAVWAALPNANMMVRVDPTTNRVVARVKLPYCPGAYVEADASGVWSTGGGCGDVVARIDSRSRRITAKVYEPHPVGLGLAFGSVWTAVLDSANVDRIDPRSGRVVARLHVGGIPIRLAVGFGSIWVNDGTGRVLRIQPQG